ncbi:MAG: flavodoxin [Coriobacteriia bacterium]|nr:flavodoxin [Coriobacteriia bacterium]
MAALVVYESIWGNTAAVARAIAEGIGEGTRVLSTAEATPESLAGIDLLVVGSPLLGFSVPNGRALDGIRTNPAHAGHDTDVSQPPMAEWLETVPSGTARLATFETRIWWSPGSAAKGIAKALAALGYRPVDAKGERFLVGGTYGPLKDGELDRARAWGEQLAKSAR